MAETVRIDLHCHSSASDGDHSPAHVAKRLAAIGVTWASLTDHNTVEGQAEFRAALNRYAISYIPGVEIDARSSLGTAAHTGLRVSTSQNEALLAVLRTVRQPWRTSMRVFWSRGCADSSASPGPAGHRPACPTARAATTRAP